MTPGWNSRPIGLGLMIGLVALSACRSDGVTRRQTLRASQDPSPYTETLTPVSPVPTTGPSPTTSTSTPVKPTTTTTTTIPLEPPAPAYQATPLFKPTPV